MSEPAWVPLGGAANLVPPGVVTEYAGAAAPTDWLLCDGAAVSRTTYAALFTAIGTAYGVGDGSTTFNLPDLRGRVPVGKGTNTDVDVLGENEGLAVGLRSPRHWSSMDYAQTSGAVETFIVGGPRTPATAWAGFGTHRYAAPTDRPTDTPAFMTLNYIIKV